MESIFFGLCLIAVVWLIAWVERTPDQAAKYWWPFEIKGFVPEHKKIATNSWRNAAQGRPRR
jgi:hypothetical protein